MTYYSSRKNIRQLILYLFEFIKFVVSFYLRLHPTAGISTREFFCHRETVIPVANSERGLAAEVFFELENILLLWVRIVLFEA